MPAVSDPVADEALVAVLIDPAERADPYPAYAVLRERAPVLDSSLGMVVLSRYDDALAALRDPRLGRGLVGHTRPRRSRPALHEGAADPALRQAYFARAGGNMLIVDPPDHTRLRRLVSRAFTPRRVAALRPWVETMVDELVGGMLDAGEVDVLTALAFPLPYAVISELVGVPAGDRDFQDLVRTSAAGLEPIIDDATITASLAASDELQAYFLGLVADRRRHRGTDMLSALVAAADDSATGGSDDGPADQLDDDEIASTAILLFSAGFETTTNLIGNGLLALLRHPDQLRRLQDDPTLAASTVEELLRWDSPVQINFRTALEPASVAGAELEPGDAVLVLQGSANRDPQRFADAGTFDVGRTDNGPLSFGSGVHHCLGAALARMEGEAVFAALATRAATIELCDADPAWRPGITLRGLASLSVELTAA